MSARTDNFGMTRSCPLKLKGVTAHTFSTLVKSHFAMRFRQPRRVQVDTAEAACIRNSNRPAVTNVS
jgi:hypothetical protein